MKNRFLREAERYAKKNRIQGIRRKIVRVLACVVVFCTTYALILPAITMEKTYCDLEEHTHSESCYAKRAPEPSVSLACTYETLGVHVHTADCYNGENQLICGQADYVIHEHNADCEDENGTIVCQLPEISAAADDPAAAAAASTTTENVHSHSDACYTPQRGQLLCQLEETPEHSHDDACFETLSVLTCGLEEGAAPAAEAVSAEPVAAVHVHSAACFVENPPEEDALTCTLPEGHVHEAACYGEDGELTCELVENHIHTDRCYGIWELICTQVEHTHDLACRSDPDADVETKADWDASVAQVLLAEEWHADMIAIARSQLGYTESTRNYLVAEDGQTIHGYTRYGSWYGNPYGDWDAMFACFCLSYAQIPQAVIPYKSTCPDWIAALQQPEYDLYRSAGEHTPEPGELIFFDSDEDGIADHVGIVTAVLQASGSTPAQVKTIEGDVDNTVAEMSYDVTDATILGYGMLPEKAADYSCGLPEHAHDELCLNEDGKLICNLEEHTHAYTCTELSKEEWDEVQQMIATIGQIPSLEEITAALSEYIDQDDQAGYDAYTASLANQVHGIYEQYQLLSAEQKLYVTNADHLLDLERMLAVMPLAETDVTPSGYNRSYNGIIPIDGYLGQHAGYANGVLQKYSGENGYPGLTKEILASGGCNVIYIDLPASTNLAGFFLGSNTATVNGTKQGVFNVDLYNDWAALRVETCSTYPFYKVEQMLNHYSSEKARIGRLTNTTDGGFILLVRRSYITNNNLLGTGKHKNLYIPTGYAANYAWAHVNEEILIRKIGWQDFASHTGWLPSSLSGKITLGYVTLSPQDFTPDAGARPGDLPVVSNIKFKLFNYSNFINKVDKTNTDSDTTGTIHSKYRALAHYFYFRGGSDDSSRDYGLDIAKYIPNVNTNKQDGYGHATYDQDGYTVNHARVEPNLWNGYPILDFTVDANGNAVTPPSGWETGKMINPRSLRFLFDQNYAETQWGSGSRHKVATGAVTEYNPTNTILQFNPDTHTYWYNSATNAVDYDIDANMFRVRPYAERTSITADWMFGNSSSSADFLPFNYSNGIVNATYHPDVTNADGTQTLYKLTDSSFRMNDVDYWFGMTMELTFIQGEDGTVTFTNTQGEKRTDVMKFTFAGDDDVWVFIDGVRILDMGGTHGTVTGTINFQTGQVTQKLGGNWEGTDAAAGAYSFPTTLKKAFALAGKTPRGGWDNDGTGNPSQRFGDYTIHTLKFYYLERGTAVANCRMEFNLPNFDNPLIVGKDLIAQDENVNADALDYLRENTEYSFRVLECDEDGNIKTDANGNPVLFIKEGQAFTILEQLNALGLGETSTVGPNGIFKLKHGQRAVFEDLLAIANYTDKQFVVQEILPDNQVGQYNEVRYTIESNGGILVEDDLEDLTNFHGFYSPKISAGEPHHVQFTNVVDTDTLSMLKVSKQLTEGSTFAADQEFTARVKLDGKLLPVGTKYVIGETEYTMDEAGVVKLKAGETAQMLVYALAGTQYEVVEDNPDGSWVVTYQSVTTDKDGTETTAATNAGSFNMGDTAQVIITNSTYKHRLPLTYTKMAMYSKDAEYDFTFSMTQTDANGTAVEPTPGIGLPSAEDLTITAICQSTVSKEVFFTFDSTVPSGDYYFKLVENDKADWIDDPSVYIIHIRVEDDKAYVHSIKKDDGAFDTDYADPQFVNYRERWVDVTKTVVANNTAAELEKEFTFTGKLLLSGTPIAPEGYTLNSNGEFTFKLKHGETVRLEKIPYSAKLTITETNGAGYTVSWSVIRGGNAAITGESTATSSFAVNHSSNSVTFTNKGGYTLPETGGVGATTYTTAGLVLLLCGMAYLIYAIKNRRKGGHYSP